MAETRPDQSKTKAQTETRKSIDWDTLTERNAETDASATKAPLKDTPSQIKRDSVEQAKEQQLRMMRDRLYSRVDPPKIEGRHTLSVHGPGQKTIPGANNAESHRIDDEVVPPQKMRHASPIRQAPILVQAPLEVPVPMPATSPTRKITLHGYRTKIIAVGVLFFVVALVLSSIFLLFGQNTISGDNIAIAVEGPFAIGGGEELLLEVAVTNRNAVTVESATLIVEYPPGTQEAGTAGKELFRERISLGSIASDETLRVPVKARLFGEENEEKTIAISVEYRVEGSNATFFKEADPLKLKISLSPVVLSIDAIKEVSSGQEIELTLSLVSNSPAPLVDLLVHAEYPFGFDFSESDPKPVKGQNLWSIAELSPTATEKITIRGVMVGGDEEERTFSVSAGVPNERDPFSLASVFMKASTVVKLTDPFVGLTVVTNNSPEKTISLPQDESVTVSITFTNTLSDTIYDGVIKAKLSGNGLNADNVGESEGFYDSSTGTITWDKSSVSGLAALAPGEQEEVSFGIDAAEIDVARTLQVAYDVSVTGRRVSENRVPEVLTNVESRTVRFESIASISSHGLYSVGPFNNSGPLPPRAEAVTQYGIMLEAQNGGNELAGATVSMTLPSYVTWLGVVSKADTVTYNAGTREVVWNIGDMDADSSTDAAFQVAFLPSISQVGSVPTLVGLQTLRATDRFTGTIIRGTASSVTTALPEDPDPDAQVGRVLPKR